MRNQKTNRLLSPQTCHFLLPLSWCFVFSLLAGVMKALKCPFLNRMPVTQVRQNAPELLQMADHCPIMGHVINKYTSMSTGPQVASMPLDNGQFFEIWTHCKQLVIYSNGSCTFGLKSLSLCLFSMACKPCILCIHVSPLQLFLRYRWS